MIEKKSEKNKQIVTPLVSENGASYLCEKIKNEVDDLTSIILVTNEDLDKYLWSKKVKFRITLLRHYPYKKWLDDIKNRYNELYLKNKQWLLSVNELNELLEISNSLNNWIVNDFSSIPDEYENYKKIVSNIFYKSWTIILWYSNDEESLTRNTITWEDLIKQFWLKSNIIFKNFLLKWLKKSEKPSKVYTYLPNELYEELEKLLLEINNKDNNLDFTDIVIIWNRSYSHWFDNIWLNRNISKNESVTLFEKKWYSFIDYNSSNSVIINDFFTVNPENYLELKNIFNIGHSSIIDFQNKLNVYLIKNPELIKIYVKSEIEELRKYSLLKLLERKDLETLNEIFREEKFRKKIKLEDYERLDKNIYNILRYYLEVYYKVLEIRSKSLYLRIKKWEDIKPDFNFDKAEYNEILELINTGKPIKYIEWKAWAGKSFLLSYIAEKLNEENLNNNKLLKLYYPVYINLSWKWLEEINDIWSGIYNDYEVVYLIDSIDESKIYWEERKELDKKLLSLSKKWKVIITSRSWCLIKYNDENNQEKVQKELLKNNQEIIEVQDFTIEQIDDYLEKYFWENTSNITKTKIILEKLNWAWNNPLILCIICEVVEKWWLKNEDWEVINLENITIIDIYRNIVDLRLIEWNSIDKNRSLENILENSEIIDFRLKFLNKLWYEMLFWNTFTKKEDLIKIIKDMKLSWWFHKDLESLNLLFREWEDWEYDFVHQSFKEYFAAKYIFEEMKNNPVFDYEDFLCQWLKKVDINFLEMLVNFIQTDEKLKEKFLEQINENESYFPEIIHYKIIYILWFIDVKVMNKYYKTLEFSLINYSIKWAIKDDLIISQIYDSIFNENIYISKVSLLILNKNGLLDNFLNDILSSKLEDSIISFILDLLYEKSFFKYSKIILKFLNSDSEIILSKIIEILWNVWWYENNLILLSLLKNKSVFLKNNIIESLWKIWWKENELIIKNHINNKSFLSGSIKWLLYIWWYENINFVISLIKAKKIHHFLLYEIIWFSDEIDNFILEEIDKWNIGFSNWIIEKFLLIVGSEKNRKFFLRQVEKDNYILNNIISVLEEKDSLNSEIIDFLKEIIEYWSDEEKLRIISIIWNNWNFKDVDFFNNFINSNNDIIKREVFEILLYFTLIDNEELLRYNIINSNDQHLLLKSIELLWEIWWKNNIKLLLSKLKNTKDINIIYEIIKVLDKIWWIKNKKIVWKYKKKYKKYFS